MDTLQLTVASLRSDQNLLRLDKARNIYENLMAIERQMIALPSWILFETRFGIPTLLSLSNTRMGLAPLYCVPFHRENSQKLRTIAHEEATLTAFHFRYQFPDSDNALIEVAVSPDANVPHQHSYHYRT